MNGFRFTYPIDVRFRDLDALGHVNNAVYLTYVESARIAYWLEITGRAQLSGLDIILARTEIDYRSPVVYGETLSVGLRIASMRRSSFVMEFQVEEARSGRLVAEGRKALVGYDYAEKRSRPLSEAVRRQILTANPDCRQET